MNRNKIQTWNEFHPEKAKTLLVNDVSSTWNTFTDELLLTFL